MKATSPATCYSCWLFDFGNPNPCRRHEPRLKTRPEVRAIWNGSDLDTLSNDDIATYRRYDEGVFDRPEGD